MDCAKPPAQMTYIQSIARLPLNTTTLCVTSMFAGCVDIDITAHAHTQHTSCTLGTLCQHRGVRGESGRFDKADVEPEGEMSQICPLMKTRGPASCANVLLLSF